MTVRRARAVSLSLVTVLALAVAAAPAPAAPREGGAAQAQQGKGTTSVALGGRAMRSLRSQRVGVRALRPARMSKGRLRLPARGGAVGKTARVEHRGGLRLVRRGPRGTRKLTIKGVRVLLGRRSSRVVARVAGRRMTLLTARTRGKRVTLNRATGRAGVTRASAKLTRKGARRIRRALRLRRVPAAAFGALTVRALLNDRGTADDRGTAPGDGTPMSGPVAEAPPPFARPASAVDVTSATITWHPRDSWVRYASSGTGPFDGIRASNGATEAGRTTSSPCPDTTSSSDAQLPFSFNYSLRNGWYDEASGLAGIYGAGDVNFRWDARTINLTLSNPEIEINGANSRTNFVFNGTGGTSIDNKRAHFLDLAPNPQPTVSADGKTRTYSLMRGVITEDGASAFSNFYVPGQPWGCMSVSFTTP